MGSKEISAQENRQKGEDMGTRDYGFWVWFCRITNDQMLKNFPCIEVNCASLNYFLFPFNSPSYPGDKCLNTCSPPKDLTAGISGTPCVGSSGWSEVASDPSNLWFPMVAKIGTWAFQFCLSLSGGLINRHLAPGRCVSHSIDKENEILLLSPLVNIAESWFCFFDFRKTQSSFYLIASGDYKEMLWLRLGPLLTKGWWWERGWAWHFQDRALPVSFLFKFVLEYSYFTMLHQFLLFSKVNGPCSVVAD